MEILNQILNKNQLNKLYRNMILFMLMEYNIQIIVKLKMF
jgi:hypothetical protein